jgi:hypothetical protein
MGFLNSLVGGAEQLLGIGSAPDYYAGAKETADALAAIAEGRTATPNPQASEIARQHHLALTNAIATAKARGLDSRALQVLTQHIQQSYQSAIEQATSSARGNLMNALQSKIGVQQNEAQYRSQYNQSNLDFLRGVGTMFAGNALGFGKPSAAAPAPAPAGGGQSTDWYSALQAGGGAGSGGGYGEIDPNALFPSGSGGSLTPGYGGGYGAGGYGGYAWPGYTRY